MANQPQPALAHGPLRLDQCSRVDLETGRWIVCHIGARPDMLDRLIGPQKQAAAFQRVRICGMRKQLGVERA